MQLKIDKDKLLSSAAKAIFPISPTAGMAIGAYQLARKPPALPSKLPSRHDIGRFAQRARVSTSVLPRRTLGQAQQAIGKYGQKAQQFFGLEEEAKAYQQMPRGEPLSRQRFIRNVFPLYSARKTIPAVGSVFDTAETLISAGLKKRPGTTFKQRLGEEIKSGTGFTGLLQSRGVPTKYALPIGLIAGLAVPGGGDVRKGGVAKEVTDEVVGVRVYANNLVNSLKEAILGGDTPVKKNIARELRTLNKKYNLGVDLKKIESEAVSLRNKELENELAEAMEGFSSSGGEYGRFGDYRDIAKKMVSFLRIAGEKKSRKTGELFREAIPRYVFGVSTDEIAHDLGMSNQQLMDELVQLAGIVGGDRAGVSSLAKSSSPIGSVARKVVKWDLKKMLGRGVPGVEPIVRRPLDEVIGVSATPTEKTVEKIIGKKELALEKQARKAAKEKAPTIGDLVSMIRESTKAGKVSEPPLPPKVRGDIASPVLDLRKWKDKRAFSLSRETMERNLKDVAGRDYPKIKKFLVDRSRDNETARARWLNNTREETEKFVKSLGIKRGSHEDALMQQFGEGEINLSKLKKETKNWKSVVRGAKYFRKKYDDILGLVNREREGFGYDPIPKRKDYFRHYQEIGNTIDSLGLILSREKLPTEIAGMTDIFKPGKPFSTAELQRKGGRFTRSAVGGFDNYLDAISRQIFHIDTVQRGRALEKYINKVAETGGVSLPNFKANLLDWTNLVSGKKARLDRALESVVGREIYGLANLLRRRTSANMVGANISSALTNYIPFTQSIATTSKPAVIRGLYEGLASVLDKSPAKIGNEVSGFLTRRFAKGGIGRRGVERAADVASSPFFFVDKFTSRSIVAAKYFEALERGLSSKEAMRVADDYATKVLADRSIGQLPNLMSNRSLGFITQFQTEINNQASFLLKDIPELAGGDKKRVLSMLAQFAALSYVFNNVFEKVTGRRPQIDPIQATLHILGKDSEEDDTMVNRVGRAIGDIGQGVPFVSSRLPVGSAIPRIGGIKGGIKNIASGNYEAGIGQVGKELSKPAFYLIPPFGGGQAKKTIEGIGSYLRGYSKTPTGRVRFPIDRGVGTLAKSATFGQWATKNAREYLKSGAKPLGEKQSETFKELGKLYYQDVMNKRVGTARASGEIQLPTRPQELEVLYKDALNTMKGYGAKKVKAQYGLVGKDLGDYQKEVDAAIALKRAIDKKYPKIALDLEFKNYNGSNQNYKVADRAKWANEKLTKAAGTPEFNELAVRMYKEGVLTDSVVNAIEELYGKKLPYRRDMGVTKRGKTRAKKVTRGKKFPKAKMPKSGLTGRRFKRTGISFYDYLNRR